MEEGQHVDQGTEGGVGAALEALLPHFEVGGAQIQLQTVGGLSDHCGE